ncbi:hypothetical protein [Ferrovum myxofaciens]|uniref:Uncharacterized protein n=2 Tax=Ferrovum myxofaciens TaxID=416213 RepID=A0A9E6SXS9_9PROT|nr:hypothetical protein [Ferrovum myxofaciens]QWY77768.1 MAG: hypothetical protein JZL65_01390 [Ferrovum myxofaciens]
MIMAGVVFWSGWMQFGSLEQTLPLIIAWNLLLGGVGLFAGEAIGVLLLRFRARNNRKSDPAGTTQPDPSEKTGD